MFPRSVLFLLLFVMLASIASFSALALNAAEQPQKPAAVYTSALADKPVTRRG